MTAALHPAGPRTRAGFEPFLLVDVLAPALLVLYVVLKFEPLGRLVDLPGSASSLVFPAMTVAVLAVTPTARLARIPISWPTFAFALWLLASRLWTESLANTDFSLRTDIPTLLLLVLLVGTIDPAVVVKVLTWTFSTIVLFSLVMSILLSESRSVEPEPGVDEVQLGFRGMFGHKNELGIFAVFGLCLVLAVTRGRTRRLLVLLMVATILGTRSATAGSGMFAISFIWFWRSAINSQRTPRERSFLLATSILSIVIALMLALRLLPALLNLYDKDLTLSGRTEIWSESMDLIGERPLAGYGFGGLWVVPTPEIIVDLRRHIGFAAAHAHNGAIGLVLEVGLVGLVLFAIMLVRLIALGVYCAKRPALSPYGWWALLSVIALVLMGMSEPLFQGAHLGLVALLTVVLDRVRNDEARAERGQGLGRSGTSLGRIPPHRTHVPAD